MSLDSTNFEMRRNICKAPVVIFYSPIKSLSTIANLETPFSPISSATNIEDTLDTLHYIKNLIISFLINRNSPISKQDLIEAYQSLIKHQSLFSPIEITRLRDDNNDQKQRWFKSTTGLEIIKVQNGVCDRLLQSLSQGSIRKFFPNPGSFVSYLTQSKEALWQTLDRLSIKQETPKTEKTSTQERTKTVQDQLAKRIHEPFISTELEDLISATKKSMPNKPRALT